MRPVSQEERERILELISQGKTRSQIYDLTHRTRPVIDRIAEEAGVEIVDGVVLAGELARSAREAREALYKERMQKLRHDLSADLERLRSQLFAPAVIFGGKDFDERHIDEPLFGDKRAIVQALDIGQRVLINLEKMREQDAGRRVMLDILIEMRQAEAKEVRHAAKKQAESDGPAGDQPQSA